MVHLCLGTFDVLIDVALLDFQPNVAGVIVGELKVLPHLLKFSRLTLYFSNVALEEYFELGAAHFCKRKALIVILFVNLLFLLKSLDFLGKPLVSLRRV